MSENWDHYNARALSPETIARSFVAPKQFKTISANRNSVLLGARGSGKTTLLRMLEPRAQITWSAMKRRSIPIQEIGLFVPVDASWLASLRQAYSMRSEADFDNLALAVYSLSVARSAIDAMIYRARDPAASETSYSACISESDEARLSEEISDILILRSRAQSLRDIRFSLTSELARLPQRISEGPRANALLDQLSDPVLIAATVCDLFNQLASEPTRRWNLLCDEIEIAPRAVQEKLFMGLRATPSPLNLKISLTPVVKGLGKDLLEQPTPANDYDVETLSYATKNDIQFRRLRNNFCESIWQQSFQDAFPDATIAPESSSILDEPDRSSVVRRRGPRALARSKSRSGQYGDIFANLAEVDPSFSSYLARKGIVPSAISETPQNLMDSIVRKVAPLAELRLFHRSTGTNSSRMAGRGSMSIYTGSLSIFDISEGHPRWLKSMFSALLKSISEKGSISIAHQSQEIEFAVQRLNSRIKAIPASKGSDFSPYFIIEKIGRFFEAEVHSEKFKADPALSFVVDSKVSSEVIAAIENGLFIGALIPMEDEISWLLSDGIVGRRLRVSYWLAPHFKLPLITGKPVMLSTILESKAAGHDDSDQLSLTI